MTSTRSDLGQKPSAIGLLTDLIRQRVNDVREHPEVVETDRWTQSTVFYRLRPILIQQGLGVNRKYLTSSIRSVCQKFGYSRADLGIVAADRAQLYFKGAVHDVGLDELTALAEKGTDMVIVEKEGVVEVLAPYADRMGVALVNTRGFLTEYATILSNLGHKSGSNMAILVDFDVSGVLITKKVPRVFKVGVDFDTLTALGVEPAQVEEPYNAPYKHLKNLQNTLTSMDSEYGHLTYLKNRRIEIDSVLAVVGAERLWGFIQESLLEKFPTRDYNRAIDIPDHIIPPEIQTFVNMLIKKLKDSLVDENDEIRDELAEIEGFLEVRAKEHEIQGRQLKAMREDPEIKELIVRLNELVEKAKGKEE